MLIFSAIQKRINNVNTDMNIQSAINKAIEKENLSIDEMTDVMHQIMTGQATDAQIGGFLIAMRTLFNLLGPLTNPAGTPNQVLGVFSKDWVRPIAEVLLKLGSQPRNGGSCRRWYG